MIPSKGQSNLPRPGAGIPPKRMPGPGAGVRPGMPRPGFPMQTGPKPLTPTNIPETAHSIESPFSAEPRHEETPEPKSGLTNPEENRPQSLVDTDEEPEIKMKKKHFEPKNFEERENTNEDEEPHTAENPNDNYVSLTESLKAMQNLRNNFVSFGEGFGAHDDDLGTPERTYKETDEEDYVKVESAEELPSKDFDDEHYDDEEGAHSPEEHHTIHGHRVIRDNYIEEIHEEAHEESRREDDEEEEEEQVHDKQEPERFLNNHNDDTHEEITPQNIPHDSEDNQEENNESEEPEGPVTPTLGHQQEEIDPEGASSAHKIKEIVSGSSAKHKRDHHEFLEKSDPEDNSQEKVMFLPHSNSAQVIPELTASAKIKEQKNKFLDDFEYGEEPVAPVTTHTHEEPVPEIKPEPQYDDEELLPPPRQITEEKVIEKPKEQEIISPPPMFIQTTKVQEEEEITPPTMAVFTHETKVQEEEEDILPPPKVLFIPESASSNKPKSVASSPFGITTSVKPESAKIKTPFTPSYKAPESATKSATKLEHKITTPIRFEPEVHIEEGDIDIPEGPETSLIVRLKKAEIELRKERVKNERIQNEKDSLLHENQSLKSEVMEIRSKVQILEKSRDAERLAQKEQETIEKLKAELKSTIEGSRLVNEHSNRIINESTKYKQDIEAFINSLEEEKKELQQTIIQLKTQIHQENLKNETLNHKIEFLEQKSQEYEASFDLIQRRTKDRAQAFEKITSLSENAKSTLESLPKVEDLISRIQPIQPLPFTTTVQTSTSQLIVPKDQGLQVAFEPKSSTTPEPLQKSGTIQTKPVNPFHVNKPTTPQKSVEFHIQPPVKETKAFDLPLQQRSSSKAEKLVIENVKKSHDFDDDLNLLLENESPVVKLNQPQSAADKNKGSAQLGGRRIEGSPTVFDRKEDEIEKDFERENEKEESLSTILHNKPQPIAAGNMKKSPSKKEPAVSFSQNITSLSKQKDDLDTKKQSAVLKSTQWDLDESATSLKNPVQLSESDIKDKPEESAPPKFTTPQSKKPVIPNFANSKMSTEENKKKSGGPLIIGKINTDQDKPSTTTTANKPKPINFGNINLSKGGSRYTQPKKGLGGNLVTDEADSFFDDLGVNETTSKGGNNTLRESVTSLRSSTSNMSRKIQPTNQFV